MSHNIHKKLILRLALAWVLLSVVIGSVIYFIEQEKIDDFVVALAETESNKFISDEIQYLDNLTSSNRDVMSHNAYEHLMSGSFLVIEFYDRNKKQVIEHSRKDAEEIEAKMNLLKHENLMTDTTQYTKIYIDDQMFLRVVTPLERVDGGIVGFFEGIYHVEPIIIKNIKDRVIFSLLQVIITILIATMVLYPVIIVLNKDLIKYSMDLSNANMGMLEVLGNAIAKRDSDTNEHNYRVTIYATRLAETMNLNRKEIQAIVKGAFLHDVGKIAISDNILLKPDKLTEEEFEVMKTHVIHGEDIIGSYAWLADSVNVVRNHHEKYAGTGYMNGLKGTNIPVTARIFAAVDVFDALTSKRPYKEPFSFDKSLQIINEGRGEHFDPVIIDAFNRIIKPVYDEIHQSGEKYLKDTVREIIDRYF
ncbi:MAG: HD domain-containing protein [Desulfamplus sp.]|nr:HD domain-containing protein [Desulfamplus sp.]